MRTKPLAGAGCFVSLTDKVCERFCRFWALRAVRCLPAGMHDRGAILEDNYVSKAYLHFERFDAVCPSP